MRRTQGGKIRIAKPFKSAFKTTKNFFEDTGHKVERGFNQAVNKTEDFAHNTAQQIGTYADVVIHGRNDYPPKVRDILKAVGDLPILSMIVDRTPVPSLLTGALNAVSLGKFGERFNQLPYDKLFHLRLDITLQGGKRVKLEKNEVINMDYNPRKEKGSEQMPVLRFNNYMTINKMLEGAQRIQGRKFFTYSAYNNNCQDFIVACLNGAGVTDSNIYSFVKQDTKSLFKGDSFLRKVANTTTDLGAKVNEITTGAGLFA